MKTKTGIAGLDTVLNGGLPSKKTTLISGAPGAGKTTLALQFLLSGAMRFEEPGLMLSFEESAQALAANAQSLAGPNGFDPAGITFLDGRPPDDAMNGDPFDLSGLIAILREAVERHGIRRIVIDGLDTLFSPGLTSAIDATEFARFVSFVHATSPVTALVLLKPSVLSPKGHFDGVGAVEHLADAVIKLDTHLNAGLVQRVLRVVKVRAAAFAAGEHAFIISDRGLELSFAGVFKAEPILSDERVSTGIERLDHMQEGGLLRSTVTLVSGLPGTAKSTLGASFLAAGLARGERVLLVALDEPAEQLVRNARSVGIDLLAPATRDHFRMLSLNASAAIADEHYLIIERVIAEFAPSILVIDPLSALNKSGGSALAELVMERLTYLVKIRGMTGLFTALTRPENGELESSVSHISTIADTWIHLSYAARGGERNRTLTIVKSRGTAHSNQLRELTLSAEGLSLNEVYPFAGDILLGTARIEQQQRDVREGHSRQERLDKVVRELEEERSAAQARMREAELLELALMHRIKHVRSESAAADERGKVDRTKVLDNRNAASDGNERD